MTRARFLVCAVVCASVAGLSAAPALATAPGVNGPIVYVADLGRPPWISTQVFAASPGGTGAVALTDGCRDGLYPSISSDGALAYARGPWQVTEFAPDVNGVPSLGSTDIWTIDQAGAHRQLTRDDVADASPAWSPDGTRIAWSRGTDREAIHVMNADGSDTRRITGHAQQRRAAGLVAGRRADRVHP